MDEILASVGLTVSNIRVRQEPEESKQEILAFEKQYQLDSQQVLDPLDRYIVELRVPEKELVHWQRLLGIFLDYGG
jgi:hypothetical protein